MSDLGIDITISAPQAGLLRDLIAKLDEVEKKAKDAAKSTDSLGEQLKKLGNTKLGDIGKKLGELAMPITTVTAIGSAVVGFGRSLAETAVHAEQNERAVRALGSSYELVRAATADTVTAQQALTLQQGLVQSGMRVTGEELAAITRRARDYALATGTETSQAVEQLTDALRGGESEGLRRFGVAVSEGQSRTTTFRQAIAQFTSEQGRAGVATRTLAEEQAVLSRGLNELAGNAVNAAGRLVGVANALGTVNSAVAQANRFLSGQDARNLESNLERNRGRVDAMEARNANARRFAGMFQAGETDQFTDLSDEEYRGVEQARSPMEARELADWQRRTRAVRARHAQRRADERTEARLFEQNYADATANEDAINRGVITGLEQARQRRRQTEINRRLRRMGLSAADVGQSGSHTAPGLTQLEEAQRDAGLDRLREMYGANERGFDSRAEAQRGDNETQFDREGRRIEGQSAARDFNQQRQRDEALRRQSERRAGDAGTQFAEAFGGSANRVTTVAQTMSQSVRGAFDSMTGSFKSHITALIQGKENIGEALRGILQETLTNLAAESTVKALYMTATGFANLAMQNYPGAASAFASAGIYAAVAGAAGLGAYAMSQAGASQQPSAGGGATRDSAARAGGGSTAAGGETHVTYVNVNGALATREDVQDAVRRAQNGGFNRNQLTTSERQTQRRMAA